MCFGENALRTNSPMVEDTVDGQSQIPLHEVWLEHIGQRVIDLREFSALRKVHEGDVLCVRVAVANRDVKGQLTKPLLMRRNATRDGAQHFGDTSHGGSLRVVRPLG